jgi:hypothetical protein
MGTVDSTPANKAQFNYYTKKYNIELVGRRSLILDEQCVKITNTTENEKEIHRERHPLQSTLRVKHYHADLLLMNPIFFQHTNHMYEIEGTLFHE